MLQHTYVLIPIHTYSALFLKSLLAESFFGIILIVQLFCRHFVELSWRKLFTNGVLPIVFNV